MATITGDPWQIGLERVRSDSSPLFYGNAIVAEVAGEPAAGLIGYAADTKARPVSDDLPDLLAPLQELQPIYGQVLSSWLMTTSSSSLPRAAKNNPNVGPASSAAC
jgi:hypothetical protein